MTSLLVALLIAATPVKIEDPWTRATPPGAKVAAGYMKISSGTADRALGASGKAAGMHGAH